VDSAATLNQKLFIIVFSDEHGERIKDFFRILEKIFELSI
jgi:hypothetical protein